MSSIIVKPNDDATTNLGAQDDLPKLGTWYWVKSTCSWDNNPKGMKKGQEYEWLGCVMLVGSNMVEIHTPEHKGGGGMYTRVHFEDMHTRLRFEPNPNEVIQGNIVRYQQKTVQLLAEIQRVTSGLGLRPAGAIAGPETDSSGSTLMVLSGQADVKGYETALVKAKNETLPELFKEMEETHKELALWMTATMMTTKAMMGTMKGSLEEIEGRIFNVGLYAGLTEEVAQCCDGQPAGIMEKLHVMQRRLYMDEEALLDYRGGGMEFKDIHVFDEWISRPDNRDRILPFPRTMVAMRVRRYDKERDNEGCLLKAFINIELEKMDKTTYLFIRNGEQVWRMTCDLDFGEMIFPDKSLYDPTEPMMVKMFGSRVDRMIPRREYEDRLNKEAQRKKDHAAWEKEHPGEHNPFYREDRDLHEWRPFDPSNVYFDDASAVIEKQIKEYNRIALIIQGLFDRSMVLHPHPPVQTWSPEGFERAIKLVFDAGTTLYGGQKPDFKAYRDACNAKLNADSVVTGQEDFWLRKEAEKENKRLDGDWRNKSSYRHKKFQPYGNPGPGLISRIANWRPRVQQATFRWLRETDWRCENHQATATVTVPAEKLFNISAYQPGDFRQFFQDPRTRGEYLQWAPMLLTAEDFHAGKRKAQDAV